MTPDKPEIAEMLRQLHALNHAYSADPVGEKAMHECLNWFAQFKIELDHNGNAYILPYPYRQTLGHLQMTKPFNYGALAREAKIDIETVISMLMSVPVRKSDAEKVLVALPHFIGKEGDFTFDTVSVVLLPE